MSAVAPARDGGMAWSEALTVAALFAVDPRGTGGIRLRALPGPVRERWLAQLRTLVGDDTPWRRMPSHIRDDRLLGGLDLTATLNAGRAVAQRGLLAEVDGGVLEITMAERLDAGNAARITAAMDTGSVALEREGLRERSAARFAVVALDEGDPGSTEATPASLCDRLAFTVDLHALSWRDTGEDWFEPAQIVEARERMRDVILPDEVLEVLTSTAVALGVWSLRPTLLAARAARAAAALNGADQVSDEEATLAAQLVLAPRATQLPPPPADDEAPEEEAQEPPPPEEASDRDEDGDPPDDQEQRLDDEARALEDRVLEATAAVIPPDVLQMMARLAGQRTPTGGGGKAGARMRSRRRGRPMGSEPGPPGGGNRLAVIDTLRAAAPWQPLRRMQQRPQAAAPEAAPGSTPRISVWRDDFRIVRYRERQETTTVFLVDASGSAALQRLAEAKGAVELLLADCYIRRDQVALIAFRGQQAQLLLPPTRSLVRAKRELAALPGGGGTPLAAGLDAARELVIQLRRQGQSVTIVALTDGRANVARDGRGGRQAAMEDALSAARALAMEDTQCVLIDVSRKPQPKAAEVAAAMNARYLPLPSADAATLSAAVRASTAAAPSG